MIFTCLYSRYFRFLRKMSTFKQQFNPVTGKLEWEIEEDDYDYQQEVARSAYADMLHDWERNLKYHNALKRAIDDLRKANMPVRVLDIGTGSGLLAMMAAKYGADSVYACEAFRPVAECASKVISDNQLSDKIKLIRKRSTELTVGPDGDMPERANLLVTEVFDTELIGEGALGTFKHAHDNLLTSDCVVIPSYAVVYVQLIQSDKIMSWHSVPDINVPGIPTILSPELIRTCSGAPAVHDLQLSQLSEEEFTPITKPVAVKTFDFTSSKIGFHESSSIDVTAIASGRGELVFMWWDIEMYPGGEILSCAPKWAHPDGPRNLPWRDHWMQAVYYLRQPLNVKLGDKFLLGLYHDEYSFWFTTQEKNMPFTFSPAPVCNCGIHVNNSRSRIGMINDHKRYSSYVSALKAIDNRMDKAVFVCGESIPLALIASKMGFKRVFLCEPISHKLEIIKLFIQANSLEGKIKLILKSADEITQEDLDNLKVDILLSEPFFSTSVLQWDNFHFLYTCLSLKKHLNPGVQIIPHKAVIYGVAVEFTDLWKIRAPVKTTEGFNLASFDSVIQSAISKSDSPVEPQPLWEYPSVPLSDKFVLGNFDFSNLLLELPEPKSGCVPFSVAGECNGVALWVDFILAEDNVVSLGPVEPLNPSENIKWYRYSQQGVHLFASSENNVMNKTLHYKTDFLLYSGKISFIFKVAPK